MATIKIGDETHEVEVKPITLICKSANMATQPDIEYPGRFKIRPEDTLYHAERVKKLHAEFGTVWQRFHANTTPPSDYPCGETISISADDIRKMGTGAKHVMGLIDLSLKLLDMKVPIVWAYPETYLHPGWQVALADLAIFFIKRWKP